MSCSTVTAPALPLRGQGGDEAVGQAELALAALALGDGVVLLLGRGVKLRLEVRDHGVELRDARLDHLELLVGLRERGVGLRELLALGLDLRDHVKVEHDVDGPVRTGRRRRATCCRWSPC